jgi:DNA-binding NarL/FixJ family response regulator
MNVLVVDDHILFREGLVSLLKADEYFKVVGQASSVHEAIDLARILRPEIILMDFSLPDGDGAEASTTILTELPHCKIVFLTMYDANEKLFAAIRSGAKGYLLKNVKSEQLVLALKSLERGEAAISPSMTMRLMEEFSQHHNGNSGSSNALHNVLSDREREILQQIALGASNDEIANRLYLSVNTVKHHVHSILSKLGLENRKQATQYAREVGLTKYS